MNAFLTKYGEKENLNQYWYSNHTIKVMVEEVLANSKKACFLSTPSIYFSLPKKSDVRKESWLFDLDQVVLKLQDLDETSPGAGFETDFDWTTWQSKQTTHPLVLKDDFNDGLCVCW